MQGQFICWISSNNWRKQRSKKSEKKNQWKTLDSIDEIRRKNYDENNKRVQQSPNITTDDTKIKMNRSPKPTTKKLSSIVFAIQF